MTDTHTLLADYVQTGSDAAFRELVSRYVDLVYSTALRLVGADRHCAEDVPVGARHLRQAGGPTLMIRLETHYVLLTLLRLNAHRAIGVGGTGHCIAPAGHSGGVARPI